MQKSVLTLFTIVGILTLSCCLQQEDTHPKEYWDELGYNLSHAGKYEEALEAYDKVLEVDPNNAKEWYNKGYCLSELGRYEEALEAYDKSLELDPKLKIAWDNKGGILSYLNRYDEAIDAYNKALEVDTNYSDAWYNKGWALHGLGRYEEALEAYDKTLELNPRYLKAWYNKGNILLNSGRYNEALEAYDRALEIDPNCVDALNNKGIALVEQNKLEDALATFNKALEINPAHEDAWNNRNCILELNSSTKWILYNNSKYSFSAEIPRGWKMAAPKLEEIETVIKPNFVITFTRELNETIEAMIIIGKTRSDIDFDEFVGYMDSDKSRVGNLIIIGRDKVEINGDNVWLIKMKISEKEELRLIEAIFECKNKDVLTVTVGSPSSKYSRYNETFYHVIRSVTC